MIVNSGAKDSKGLACSITFTMTGLDIDPNGGTFDGYYDAKLPNLIFTFNNTAWTQSSTNTQWGSWVGTIFSTAKATTVPGSVAKINGVSMGFTGTGNATGAWTGIKAGTGSSNAPLLRGLAWIDAGWKSQAPYGNASLTAANDGLIDTAKDPNVRLAIQGPLGGFPVTLGVSIGSGKGARPSSFDFSGVWAGYGSVYLQFPLLAVLPIPTSTKGQFSFTDKLPNDPRLKGLKFIWQGVAVTTGKPMVTNPVVTDVK